MSRLYWRIFISFWGVLLATLLVTLAVNTLMFRDDVASSRMESLVATLDALAEQAQRTLNEEGETGLRGWLESKQASLQVPMFILDPQGNELMGRPVPIWMNGVRQPRDDRFELRPEQRTGLFPERRIEPPPEERSRARRPRQRTLRGPDGNYTLLVRGLQQRPGERWMRDANARRLFPLVLFLMSGIACLFLARYLTRPIAVFRAAGQKLGAGDLNARVGAPVNQRKDEFGALAKDFDRMAEQVQGLLESRQRLLREVSHELRSPLARLQAAVGLMRQQQGDASSPNLDRIEQEAATLNDMIGQILAFARLQSQEYISRERVDVVELVSAVVDNANYEGQASGREVVLSASGAVHADLDEALLQSAIDNVVRNAVQHSRKRTDVSVVAVGDNIEITVTDDGPGAPEENLPKLFDVFFTAAPSNSSAGQGAGIGLAIAKRAVELHGGSVVARNRKSGSGLEVVFSLKGAV